MTPTIALVGDDRGHPSHQELNALIPRLSRELGVTTRWVQTASGEDHGGFDGIWLAPGSPYDDDRAAYAAITVARTRGIPFLGSCGGMQYAVVEFLRNVVGERASHAETDGVADDNAVARMACSLYGERRLVTPVAGSRFASWVLEPFVGMHYCKFAPTETAVATLVERGVVVGATAPDAPAEVLEFPDHPFLVTSLFQPHIGASRGEPIHPLIEAFARAVLHRS